MSDTLKKPATLVEFAEELKAAGWDDRGDAQWGNVKKLWSQWFEKQSDQHEIVVFKDGSYRELRNGGAWELQNDPDWLVTINLQITELTSTE